MSATAEKKGKLITFEGGEGGGKSTQIGLLTKALKARGLEVVRTREPGGTPGGEKIRSLLVNGDIDLWKPLSEALLNYAARFEHVSRLIVPALERGAWVLSDRFSDSTLAYQGYAHALDRETIARLHRLVLGAFEPDLTLILDIPVDVGLARARARGDGEDRYERMEVSFHHRLRDGFLDIARKNIARCAIIDGEPGVDDVQRAIRAVVQSRFGIDLS
ncbi:dTMP kinase [Varunaivibrio sulfuroxidans]|uniref:Thymidylate kinase n=1 Tax=Varunaivibrio sulfuroxidans TaxID=1773489 RepID=A0A4R3JE63_9PROT|nr:dTMP kinase [Varunaivibrio sulfuroxidans]TCS64369.1 thymidylate kinase [Varunaivibrio sulfuroxidans]WES31198.1 dTMP kinase [Varunaivibrio sulfuroxidans]